MATLGPGPDEGSYDPATAELTSSCPMCAALPGVTETAAVQNPAPTSVAPATMSGAVPALSSRPAATAKLFLDFDGRFEASWNGRGSITTPAFDLDGNPSQFNSTELAAIAEIWKRVAEDYAPFHLDVTTVDPGHLSERVVAVIAIGGHYSDWFGSATAGVALTGGFYNSNSNVGFVFAEALQGNVGHIAESASHEAGHLFGLSHQSVWSGGSLVQSYDTGNAALAPIMGSGYAASRSVWDQGATTQGPSALQDDMAIIASASNGFGYRPDDFGNTTGAAAPLPAVGTAVDFAGLIGRSDDRDVWSITTGGGTITLRMTGIGSGTNLNAVLELRNSAGVVVAMQDPSNSLDAELSVTVGAGTFHVVARSSGQYGDVGQYRLSGTLPAAVQSYVLDDGVTDHRLVGGWKKVTNKGFSGDSRTASKGNGSLVSSWTFNRLPAGTYEVWATWAPASNNATNAPYILRSDGKLQKTTRVNQKIAAAGMVADGVGWRYLGTVEAKTGSVFVKLANNANGVVVADAVRLQRVFPTQAPLGDISVSPPNGGSTSGGQEPGGQTPEQPRDGTHPPLPSWQRSAVAFLSSKARNIAPVSVDEEIFTEQEDWSAGGKPTKVDHWLELVTRALRR